MPHCNTLQEWQQPVGWMNCSFNIFPLLCLVLSNVYEKMRGKSVSDAPIFVNKEVRMNLLWFADHIEVSSGMPFFANID